jgi:alpha-N-arabinofuranosidase
VPRSPLASQKLPENVSSIDLKIEGAGPTTRCFYKIGNGDFKQLGKDLDSSFLSTETAGGFQGVTLGVFAHK